MGLTLRGEKGSKLTISELDSKIELRVELLNDNLIKDNLELETKFNQIYNVSR